MSDTSMRSPYYNDAVLLRFLPCTVVSALFVLSFVGYLYAGNAIGFNPDTLWHIAAGEWIIQHHAIPDYDPWSFTSGHTQWLNVSWLWDIIISLVLSGCGSSGLYVFMCLVGAFNIAVLVMCLKVRTQTLDTYIILVAALVWLAQLMLLFPQPQLATVLFTLLFHHGLYRCKQQGIVSFKNAMLLAALIIIWANMHGGFIMAYTILFAYGMEAYEQKNAAWLSEVCRLSVICVAACFINPYHFHIIEAVLRSLNSCITPYLADWHPFSFSNGAFAIPLAFFIISSNVRDPHISLADKILTFAWLMAGLGAVRNFVLFLLVAAPYMTYCLQELARATQRERFSPINFLPDAPAYRIRSVLFAMGASLMVTFCVPFNGWSDPEKFDLDPYDTHSIMSELKEQYPHVRFFNDYNLGGYMIYNSGRTWRLFVDGRAGTAYPESVLQDAIDFNASATSAAAVIHKYNIGGIILKKDNPRNVDFTVTHGWKIVSSNKDVTAYVHEGINSDF